MVTQPIDFRPLCDGYLQCLDAPPTNVTLNPLQLLDYALSMVMPAVGEVALYLMCPLAPSGTFILNLSHV